MTVETRFDAEKRLVRQTYAGSAGLPEYEAATQEAVELFQKHGSANCLVDLRRLENTASLTDVYSIPLTYGDLKVPSHAKLGILIDAGQIDEPIIRFFETVCLNRGWNARIIFNEEEALRWLME